MDKVSVSIFFRFGSNLILIYTVYAQLVLFTIGKGELLPEAMLSRSSMRYKGVQGIMDWGSYSLGFSSWLQL